MLGIGGRFAGAKGMVQMPDLANLNPEQAAALIASNGLRVRNQNSNNTTNSALGNKVFGQSITAGELVDYETQIDFSYYAYAAPAVTITYGSPEPYDTTPEYGCNKTPNSQGSTNQYYYCTRNTTYYRSKKYEDGVVLFYDSEFGTPQSYFETFGIDLDSVIHTPITDVEELKHDIMKQLKGIEREDKVFILVDSIGNLASKKEVEDALDGKSVADMTRAKQLKSLFRMVTPHLTLKDIPMAVVNHTYKEIGMFPKDIVGVAVL